MSTSVPCTTTELADWEEAKRCFSTFSGSWLFRGHAASHWSLVTSIERATAPTQLRLNAEQGALGWFQQGAHNYLTNHWAPTSTLEWLALMQHHGTPTRLMDWTRSPFVAAFFAFEDERPEADACAIWAIDASWCLTQTKSTIQNLGVDYSDIAGMSETSFYFRLRDIFDDLLKPNVPPFVCALGPARVHERLALQQGVFVFPGNGEMTFEDNLRAFEPVGLANHLHKLVLPRRLRVNALADLVLMNITRVSLFPGLDGFARTWAMLNAVESNREFQSTQDAQDAALRPRSPGLVVRWNHDHWEK